MTGDIISKKTRQVFREHLVSWTLRQIRDEFDAADIVCNLDYQPPVSGERRTLVEQYYQTVNWSNARDVRRVLQAYENVISRAEEEADSDYGRRALHILVRSLQRDGFNVTDGHIVAGTGMSTLVDIKETATAFDSRYLADQLRRIEESVASDPALAIGTAKELIETCCRTILAERGKPVKGTPDISELTKATIKELRLVPEQLPEATKAAEAVRRLLGSLGTIAQAEAELRNLWGTGHGRDGNTAALPSRYAKLVVGSAATLVRFLFDTHNEMK